MLPDTLPNALTKSSTQSVKVRSINGLRCMAEPYWKRQGVRHVEGAPGLAHTAPP